MRKLILLAALIVIAVLLLTLARSLTSRAPVATLPHEPAPAPKATSPAHSVPDAATEIERHSREAAGAKPDHVARAPEVGPGTLRIRVAFANQPAHEPHDLQVRVSDLLGVQREAHRESPLEFVVSGLALGEYVVVADEDSAIRTAVHAKVTEPRNETLVEVILEAQTKLQVRWRSTDGEPIVAAIGAHLEDGLHRSLTVYASRAPIVEAGPPPASVAIASLVQEFEVERDPTTDQLVLQRPHDRLASVDGKTVKVGIQPVVIRDDLFGELNVPAQPPFFVSAWSCGALIETQSVSPGQTEVVFTTTLAQVTPSTVSLKLCVVDEETGQPRRDAKVWTSGVFYANESTEDQELSGCHELEVEQGQVTLHIDQYADPDAVPKPAKFVSITRELRISRRQPLDLGLIGVFPARKAKYHVVDESGKSVEGAEFAIIRMSSYDGGAERSELRRMWSDPEGVVTFDDIALERYAITCTSPRLDATPFVIDGSRIAANDQRITATIVVRPVRQISLVFDEPPRVGTLMMIETPDGLPVRTLEMDEFGIVPLWLGGTDYRVHLVEDGEPTQSVLFSVPSNVPSSAISDPCILRIKR